MNRQRRLPLARLIGLVVAVVAVLAAGTALAAGALSGGGAKPPAKPLAQALHDAATAPAVNGVSADIRFTNHLIDGASLAGGGTPLLTGATGRLWAAPDGRVRLELQSDRGDAQIVSDGRTATVYDASSNTAYKVVLPADKGGQDKGDTHGPPTVGRIQQLLDELARSADIGGAVPANVAGRKAYTVKLSPSHDGGLVGAAKLAWDAANGTPLRAAVYASDRPDPVLELEATHISFGKVAGSALTAAIPAGAKVVKVDMGARTAEKRAPGHAKDVTGAKAVAAKLPFALKAPDTLVGLPRQEVRLLGLDGEQGALVTYGAGLGGIAVVQTAAKPAGERPAPRGERRGLALPKISIPGTTGGQELATALGTAVTFERDGVRYTILGSVTPQAAEAAARGL
jgi:outer membrane lipoprotein-sorting protein